MQSLNDRIKEVKKQFNTALKQASNTKELEAVRVNFLGKKGLVTQLVSEIKNLSIEDKRTFGPVFNELKKSVEDSLTSKAEELQKLELSAKKSKKTHFDVSAYKPTTTKGSLHPYTQIIEEIEDIFLSMGYDIKDGHEVETDYYNFTGLNIPEDHPARDMYDTFWTTLPNVLLRTHTSPVQVHTMESQKPPISVIVPGRCYRHEATDASHDFMFMQCEGFIVDKNVTLANLFATAKTFLQKLFNKTDLKIRIRPGFFPFVEPGVEIDMECPFCKDGCSVCKKTKWIEVFPGGLIHPNVLKSARIDPDKYSGFAFGFGLTRLAMIKYGINDIRLFHSGKIRFLEQF